MTDHVVADLNIAGPFCVLDLNSGHYIYQHLDRSAPGDLPPDIACLPVVGFRSVGSDTARVLYIDVIAD